MMTAPICPQCRQVIVSEDINVAKDLAYCRRCNAGQKLSELLGISDSAKPVNLKDPPAGAWCTQDLAEVIVGASHRSWGKALGLLGISLFWNGIVSVFVLVALSGTMHRLTIGVPEWFPAPKMNGHVMGLGELVFLWIFLTPFIVIGGGMLLALLSTVGGKTEVRIRQGLGSVYVGIGRLGWNRRFDPALVKSVRMAERTWRNDSGGTGSQTEIRLEEKSGKVIKFGSLLSEERQHFLSSALQQLLR